MKIKRKVIVTILYILSLFVISRTFVISRRPNSGKSTCTYPCGRLHYLCYIKPGNWLWVK